MNSSRQQRTPEAVITAVLRETMSRSGYQSVSTYSQAIRIVRELTLAGYEVVDTLMAPPVVILAPPER